MLKWGVGCICEHGHRVPWGPEEGVVSPGAGVTDACELLSAVLGTLLQRSAKVPSVLYGKAITPAPAIP